MFQLHAIRGIAEGLDKAVVVPLMNQLIAHVKERAQMIGV